MDQRRRFRGSVRLNWMVPLIERIERVTADQLWRQRAPRTWRVEQFESSRATIHEEHRAHLAFNRRERRHEFIERNMAFVKHRRHGGDPTRRPAGPTSPRSGSRLSADPTSGSRLPSTSWSRAASSQRGPPRTAHAERLRNRVTRDAIGPIRRTTPGSRTSDGAGARIVRLMIRFCLAPRSSFAVEQQHWQLAARLR
jgi:hypothetical protein